MKRFIILFFLFVIAGGIILHLNIDIPFISNFLGKLPGDVYITKDNTTISFPLVSALIATVIVSLVLSLFVRKKI